MGIYKASFRTARERNLSHKIRKKKEKKMDGSDLARGKMIFELKF